MLNRLLRSALFWAVSMGLVAAMFMYLNIRTGGIKGATPSRDFLTYLAPMLLLLPPCMLLAAITPDRR